MWCVAELDRAYIRNMEDALAPYEQPYNPAEPVVCIDEKPVSPHTDVRPPSLAKPGANIGFPPPGPPGTARGGPFSLPEPITA
jgi:hypothetical protein